MNTSELIRMGFEESEEANDLVEDMCECLSGAERLLLLLFLFGWHWVWHPIYVALRENEKVRERASLYIPPSSSAPPFIYPSLSRPSSPVARSPLYTPFYLSLFFKKSKSLYRHTQSLIMPKSNDQKHFFIYALVPTGRTTDYHHVDMASFDDVVSSSVYYGLTQNPQKRLSQHRPRKGSDLGMVVIDECDHPLLALKLEADYTYEHFKRTGEIPKHQGMANSGVYS